MLEADVKILAMRPVWSGTKWLNGFNDQTPRRCLIANG